VDDAAGPASCPTYPDWSISVNLPVGETIEFKAVKYDGTTIEWETGDNREYTIPETGGALSIDWNADMAVGPALCPNYPTWETYIDVPAGKSIKWKALKKVQDQQKYGKVETIIYIRHHILEIMDLAKAKIVSMWDGKAGFVRKSIYQKGSKKMAKV